MRRPPLPFVLLFLLACGGAPRPASEPGEQDAPTGAPRPNVVLVLFEDMSARVGAYGDEVARTPAFDRIAAEGVLYTNAYTAAGVCAPSRAALMTGRYANTVGAQHMRTTGYLGAPGGGPQDYLAVPPPSVKAFPELLRAAGYYASNDWKTDYQFGEPFTIWDRSEEGADWTGRAEGQPFFAMITLLTTHESFVWPTDMEADSPLVEAVLARNDRTFTDKPALTDPAAVTVPPYLPDVPAVRRDIATHYDNIAFTDAALGRLYDRLEAEGLLDETILIVSTDHGDGLPRMKRSLYDAGLHVPFVVRYPDGHGAGTVTDELISFVDIGPTVLSWAGVKPPRWMHGQVATGADRAPPRPYVFATLDRMDTVPNHRRAVRDQRYKLIRNSLPDSPYFTPLPFRDVQPSMRALWAARADGTLPDAARPLFAPLPRVQLYDTDADPHEVRNLAGDPAHAAVEARLLRALEDWEARVGDQSAVPEAAIIEAFWPGGVQPVTAPPRLSVGPGGISLAAAEGASVGYRLGEGPWRLYVGPFVAPAGTRIEAKAIRYGYAESDVMRHVVP